MEAYTELARVFTRLYRLNHASSMLTWDQMVNLPPASNPPRVAALAELAVLKHELITSPELARLLDAAEVGESALSPLQVGNLREMRREWRSETKLPKDLLAAITTAKGNAQQVWGKCRPANDWATFKPCLEEIVSLSRKAGD